MLSLQPLTQLLVLMYRRCADKCFVVDVVVCCHCGGCSRQTRMHIRSSHWLVLLKPLTVADAGKWTYSGLVHCASFFSLTGSMKVLSNVSAINYKGARQLTKPAEKWSKKILKKKKKRPLLLLVDTKSGVERPYHQWQLNNYCVKASRTNRDWLKERKINFLIGKIYFVSIIFDSSRRHRAQFHNSASREWVCVKEHVAQESGRIMLWNPLKREQRGPLEAGQLGRLWSRSPVEMCLFM